MFHASDQSLSTFYPGRVKQISTTIATLLATHHGMIRFKSGHQRGSHGRTRRSRLDHGKNLMPTRRSRQDTIPSIALEKNTVLMDLKMSDVTSSTKFNTIFIT